MAVMKKYFTYSAYTTMCGIPNITLEGTLEDWQDIKIRV